MKEVRNTSQKEMIQKVLLETCEHLTGDQVYELVSKEMPTISRATVFRNLKNLAIAGEIGRVQVVDGADFFDYRHHNHYHFKCTKCQRVLDTDMLYDSNLDRKDAEFKIERHVTIFYGICPACCEKE